MAWDHIIHESDSLMREQNPSVQEAAVLVPLYVCDEGEIRIVLVRRSDKGIHGGEIALPGGKRIPSDNTLLDTALRETKEEIDLDADTVEVLEHLPTVETVTTGFRISPFLARIIPPEEWHIQEEEIAEVLEVKVSELTRPEAHGEETRHVPNWPGPDRFPFYRVGSHKLWGATYRILHPLIPRLMAEEWSF
jgi:8-oxo-dGTP pyrophosphatase MutT (NUDIX family)